eukprot:350683-Chlamydomonas_euryale.AAC.3
MASIGFSGNIPSEDRVTQYKERLAATLQDEGLVAAGPATLLQVWGRWWQGVVVVCVCVWQDWWRWGAVAAGGRGGRGWWWREGAAGEATLLLLPPPACADHVCSAPECYVVDHGLCPPRSTPTESNMCPPRSCSNRVHNMPVCCVQYYPPFAPGFIRLNEVVVPILRTEKDK